MFLTKEEITKRRISYQSAEHHGLTATFITPAQAVELLDEIESRDTQIDDLKKELFEVRHASGQRLDKTLSSIDETLGILKEFVKRSAD